MDSPASAKIYDCPVMHTIAAVGGKWKPRILWVLRSNPARFGLLQRATGASTRMLAKSLRELESDGVIDRTEGLDGAVPTTLYAYSTYGRSLVPVLDAMGEWGLQHRSRTEPS